MPPCKSVLLKKLQRTSTLAKMIKCSSNNIIVMLKDGWIINDRGEMEIDFFDGNPYPENITDISIDTNNEEENDDEDVYCSSDESDESDESDYDD